METKKESVVAKRDTPLSQQGAAAFTDRGQAMQIANCNSLIRTLPLSEKVRIELFIPDLPDSIYSDTHSE